MPIFNNILAGAAGQAGGAAAAGPIKSVRFNSADDAYLDRTPSSAGNRRTWTWSAWVKRCAFGATHCLFFGGATDSTLTRVIFGNDTLELQNFDSGTFSVRLETNALHRDPAAWYHFIVAVDTTQATAADRVKMYINGVEQDSFLAATYPTQNQQLHISNNVKHSIGLEDSSALYYKFDGYMADVFFIDGQQLDHTSFGAFDDNGVWQAAEHDGTFGTNGFHLFDFANESTVGHDSSGNENDFTANNISTTAGAGNDVLFDVPTNGTQSDTGAGGEVSGNYATLNPLVGTATLVNYSNGNLECSSTASTGNSDKMATQATIGARSGKFYWECSSMVNSLPGLAIDFGTANSYVPSETIFLNYSGTYYNQGSATAPSQAASWTSSDVIGVALNMDDKELTFYKNGTAQGTFTGLIDAEYFPSRYQDSSSSNSSSIFNFGQRPFVYPVSGYKALCTTNLPTPTIADGSDYFDALTWTGDGTGSRSFTDLSFQPDLTWVKIRTQAYTHTLYDSVRGAGSGKELQSDSTNAEGGASTDVSGYLSLFNSDGFSSTAGSSDNDYFNKTGNAYVAWNWDAGSSTVSNTDGSITSSVRASQTSGFSIVSWSGSGANATIGHGLNAAPEFIILKDRDYISAWYIYHKDVGSNKYLSFDAGAAYSSPDAWNSTDPTSSVFSVISNVNSSGSDLIAYCFAPVAGYSALGSYEGNGDGDGTFVYTKFRPAFIIIKNVDTASTNWAVFDTKREGYNVDNDPLYANKVNAEATTDMIDILSNGFKLRATFSSINSANKTYIYAAFAENPFQANGGLAR